jgi:putative ABC transport system permease protein
MVGLSMLSAVNERKKEIGVLRSLGYSRGRVFAIFSSEALFLGLLSGVLGYLAGHAAGLQVLQALDVAAEGARPLNGLHLAAAGAGMALVAVCSAAFPAWKASRVQPAETLIAL